MEDGGILSWDMFFSLLFLYITLLIFLVSFFYLLDLDPLIGVLMTCGSTLSCML